MHVNLSKRLEVSRAIKSLRDKTTMPAEFRRSLFKVGQYITIAALSGFETTVKEVETTFTTTTYLDIADKINVIGVLRAALPMVDGVLEVLPEASCGFLSASRGRMLDSAGTDFDIELGYSKIPDNEGRVVIIVDPMLATASTLLKAIEVVKAERAKDVLIFCAIASEFGVKRLEQNYPDIKIYAGAIDPILNEKGYIVPGLGDAGDRAFNTSH